MFLWLKKKTTTVLKSIVLFWSGHEILQSIAILMHAVKLSFQCFADRGANLVFPTQISKDVQPHPSLLAKGDDTLLFSLCEREEKRIVTIG